MADEQESQEKSEEPTERRLKKARDEGTVPRSKELSTTLVTMLSLVWIFIMAPYVLHTTTKLFRHSFQWRPSLTMADSGLLLESAINPYIWLFSSFFVIVFIGAILGGSTLGGLVATFKMLRPKLERLSVIKGAKRIFSLNSLMELVKGILKIGLVALVAYVSISWHWPQFVAAQRMAWPASFFEGMELVIINILIIASVSIIVAAIDIPFQVQQFKKQVRMSRQELKEEMKETDGNPEVKSKRRSLQMEYSQMRSVNAVSDADVVITNPTHFSIALKYDPDKDEAPMILGMGVDLVALQMRTIAREKNIVIFEAPQLARALYFGGSIDQFIPQPLFLAVARVLAYVMQLRAFRKGSAEAPTRPTNLKVPSEYQYSQDGKKVASRSNTT